MLGALMLGTFSSYCKRVGVKLRIKNRVHAWHAERPFHPQHSAQAGGPTMAL
jgi:hypothetical protein